MMLALIFKDFENLNNFKQLAMAAILFFKMRSKFFTAKRFAGQDFPWTVFTFLSLRSNTKGDIRMF